MQYRSEIVRFAWSDLLIAEVSEVIARPKFDRYVRRELRVDTADALLASGPVFPLDGSTRLCRDPGDDHLLELARVAKANYLVTGDRDLLVLDPFQDTRIVSPAMFLAVVGG